jgi:hypothetical protein
MPRFSRDRPVHRDGQARERQRERRNLPRACGAGRDDGRHARSREEREIGTAATR